MNQITLLTRQPIIIVVANQLILWGQSKIIHLGSFRVVILYELYIPLEVVIQHYFLAVIHSNKEFYIFHLFELGRLEIGLNVKLVIVLELLSQASQFFIFASQFLIIAPNHPTANIVLQFEIHKQTKGLRNLPLARPPHLLFCSLHS